MSKNTTAERRARAHAQGHERNGQFSEKRRSEPRDVQLAAPYEAYAYTDDMVPMSDAEAEVLREGRERFGFSDGYIWPGADEADGMTDEEMARAMTRNLESSRISGYVESQGGWGNHPSNENAVTVRVTTRDIASGDEAEEVVSVTFNDFLDGRAMDSFDGREEDIQAVSVSYDFAKMYAESLDGRIDPDRLNETLEFVAERDLEDRQYADEQYWMR